MADHATTLPERPAGLPHPAFPFQSRFVEIEAQRVRYIDEGAGPALQFVSAGQWSFIFRDVILRLRHQFRCLTLDFPGSGLSPDAVDRDQSVRANAWVLDGFIDALDLQDITMVVHDAGGPIGFLIATMRPERFRALVISNTFGWPLREYPSVRLKTKLADIPVLTLFGGKNDPLGWQRRFGLMFRNVTAVRIEDGHRFPFNDDPDRYAAAIGDWWAKKVAEAHRQF